MNIQNVSSSRLLPWRWHRQQHAVPRDRRISGRLEHRLMETCTVSIGLYMVGGVA